MKNSFKKVIAGLASSAIVLTQFVGMAVAYNDVPTNSWFADAVDSFVQLGHLDSSKTSFLPSNNATRSEMLKLIVELNGGIITSPPAISSFTDVASNAWYYGYWHDGLLAGFVNGDNNCGVTGASPCFARPNANISRAEAAAMIVRSFNLSALNEAPAFADVSSSAWYAGDIATAADHCVIQGDANTGLAAPTRPITRAEMVVMLHRVDFNLTYGGGCAAPVMGSINSAIATNLSTVEVDFSMDVDATMGADATMYVVSDGTNTMTVSSAVVNGSTVTLTLGSNLTPGTTYTVSVVDMKDVNGDMFSDSESFTFQNVAQGNGDLEITLSNPNQMGDTVPKGAVSVKMVSYDLTASCSDAVSVSRMTLVHEGFGDDNDIKEVYALVNGGRVSSSRSISNSDQEVDIVFSPALMVPACGTVQVDVAVDIDAVNAQSNGEHNFALYANTDVSSNAQSVVVNGPLTGETFEIASVTSGTATFRYRNVSPNQVDIGDTDVIVSEFEVEAGNEDLYVKSVTLEQDGSANSSDLGPLSLMDGNTVVAGPVTMNGDYVTFVLPGNGILIDDGDDLTFEVVTDQILDGANEDVVFRLEEDSDLVAVGALYGFGTNGQVYGSPVTVTGTPATVDIEAGEFSIEIDGPASTTYSPDTQSVSLAHVEFETGGEPVDVNEVWFMVAGQHGSGSAMSSSEIDDRLDDVELVSQVNGTNYNLDYQSLTTPSAGWALYSLEDATFTNVTETYSFEADITNDALTGDMFQVFVCTTSKFDPTPGSCAVSAFGVTLPDDSQLYVDAEGITSGEDIEEVDPGGPESGKVHDIEEATLNISVDTLKSADSAVANADGVALMRFEVHAGETSDVLIDEFKFGTKAGVVNNDLEHGRNYSLYYEDASGNLVLLEGGVSDDTTTFVFDNFQHTVMADDVVFFEVHADVANSVNAGDALQIEFFNQPGTPTDFVDAEDDDGSNLMDAEITYAHEDATLWSFVDAGELYVTRFSNAVSSQQLIAGETTEAALRLEFEAEFEDITVEQINITTANANPSIEKLNLYIDGSTTAVVASTTACAGTASPTAPGRMFCADYDFDVVDGDEVIVEIHPVLQSENNGGISGEQIVLSLNTSAGFDAIEARGVESSTDLLTNNGNSTAEGEIFIGQAAVNDAEAGNYTVANVGITSNTHFVVYNGLKSITNALADNGGTIPAGPTDFGVWEFEAYDTVNNGTITIDNLLFNVNGGLNELNASTFKVYINGDSNNSAQHTCTATGTPGTIAGTITGTIEVDCTGILINGSALEIADGDTVTIHLEADITPGTDTTLQASIQSFTDSSDTAYGAADSHVQWTDEANGSSSSYFWFDYGTSTVKSATYTN